MTIDSTDDSKISNRTFNTNRVSNRTYDSKSNRITKLRRSLQYVSIFRMICRPVVMPYQARCYCISALQQAACQGWYRAVVILCRHSWLTVSFIKSHCNHQYIALQWVGKYTACPSPGTWLFCELPPPWQLIRPPWLRRRCRSPLIGTSSLSSSLYFKYRW